MLNNFYWHVNIEIQKRREDIFYAHYIEGMSVDLISECSGHRVQTVRRDLDYINENPEEFNSCALPEHVLAEAEDRY